jgi:hypothetical protein
MNGLASPGRKSFRSSLLAQHPIAELCGPSTKVTHQTIPGTRRSVDMTEQSARETTKMPIKEDDGRLASIELSGGAGK